ncbi:spindle pole body-associated protein sad1 [Apiospora phragmitis]|uniref:Spindle pole body-associated protein sad1 n=1 Tax=Apiospora phragmitis TaxID=2905665 RepID=A0ABR1T7E8_9PEZI
MFLMFGGTVLALMFCIQLASKASEIQLQDYTPHSGMSWNFWPSVKDSFAGLIPTMRNPLPSLGDADSRRLVDRLNRFESRLGQLGKTIAEFPSKCYLKVDKKGKTHVPEDFWHAVKDRIQAEMGTTVNYRDDGGELPPHFWASFKRILDGEKTTTGVGTPGASGAPCNMDDVDALVEKKLLSGWESWLRQNSETVSKILGPNMANEVPAKTEKELKAHLEKLVKSGGDTLVVSKEQFAKQVQKELETHRKEFQAELREITERNEKISQALNDAQNNPPEGMSRLEIKNLVDQWAKKAVADAKFEAMAQTGIKSRLDDHLASQVNFFGTGSGAVIDPTYTSPMWKIPPKPLKSKAWLQKDGYKPQPALVALQHWTDEGQCFCTGNDRNTLSVLLSRDITPQHLVVEHILPGATLDPEAMPREIEVWAYFEELTLRSTVSAWSAAQFPDTPEEKTLNQGFVKVGHFVYRHQNAGDRRGMQLFKLSSELAGFDAVTHHVVIRAVSNYGADHTCFYRLRLFGDVIQEEMDNEKKRA